MLLSWFSFDKLKYRFPMYNTLNSAIFHPFSFILVILESAALFLQNKLLIMIFCCKMNEIQEEREDIPEIGTISKPLFISNKASKSRK